MVTAPFSFEVFLSASDEGIINLLDHYSKYSQAYDDYYAGGTREVGWQLREASSRQPSRFLKLLAMHWINISANFRDDIMEGVANHLAYRHGNLRPNGTWTPIEEPDAPILANQILEELERHPAHWCLNRSTAEALKACAHIIQDEQNAARLVFWTIGFANLREEITLQKDSSSLLNASINMVTDRVAEALMILINNLQEKDIVLPELLLPTLCKFASNANLAIRALVLQWLPYLQHKDSELDWKLFDLAMQDSTGLWKYAERCLYYAYQDHFDRVSLLLDRIRHEGNEEDMETWGRISALSTLHGYIDLAHFLDDLTSVNITEAWKGAASVWTNTENIKQYREQCFKGIKAGLEAGNSHAMSIVKNMENIFRENTPPIFVSLDLMKLYFNVRENDEKDKFHDIFRIGKWLNAIVQRDPDFALGVAEIYLNHIKHTKQLCYDYDDQFVKLLTRLFSESEEREDADQGAMLNRVVSMQDSLLSLGVRSINDWLKMAERQ